MTFSEIFIRRPVLSTVVSLLILLLGAQGITGMSIRQYPQVDETVITVTTAYPGASADVIQGFITSTIEKAVSSAEGVDYVTSKSALGLSTVSVHMRLNADPDKSLTEVIAKVQQVRGQLPSDAKDPVIQKGTGFSFALMYLAARSDNMNPQQLTEYLTRVIQPRFATVNGVADAQILGAQEFAMRIWVDPIAMAARDVTAVDILTAIQNANFLSAPGSTKNEYYAYSIEAKTTLQTAEAFGELPIRGDGDSVVRLGRGQDRARRRLHRHPRSVRRPRRGVPRHLADARGQSARRRDGRPQGAYFDPGRHPARDADHPPLQFDPGDQRVDRRSAEDDRRGGRHRRPRHPALPRLVPLVVIPIVTIPLSLIGVCFLMSAAGYSLNTLTLLAMVLSIGLVVDDAIVVVENIHRHVEEGMKPLAAAIQGMRELSGAVIAMTITLAAVFAPIAFTTGVTGSLFREFALTLAGAVVISGFIALTVSPMMSARLLTRGGSRFARLVDRVFEAIADWYERRLTGSLRLRPLTLLIVAALMATTGFLFLHTSTELAPEEDQGALFSLVTGPQYATLPYTTLFLDEIDKRTSDIPEVTTRFSVAGTGAANSAFAAWVLKPWAERTRSQAEIQQEIQPRLNGGRAAGLRLRDPLAARHRRRPADLLRHPVDRFGRARLRAGRGDPPEGHGVRQVHRRPGFPFVRQAAGQRPHRPPACGFPRGLGIRHRQHADPACRRERRLQIRPRRAGL